MERDYWITTEQVVKELMNASDNEQEYTRYLGGILRSTHWFIFDSKEAYLVIQSIMHLIGLLKKNFLKLIVVRYGIVIIKSLCHS